MLDFIVVTYFSALIFTTFFGLLYHLFDIYDDKPIIRPIKDIIKYSFIPQINAYKNFEKILNLAGKIIVISFLSLFLFPLNIILFLFQIAITILYLFWCLFLFLFENRDSTKDK